MNADKFNKILDLISEKLQQMQNVTEDSRTAIEIESLKKEISEAKDKTEKDSKKEVYIVHAFIETNNGMYYEDAEYYTDDKFFYFSSLEDAERFANSGPYDKDIMGEPWFYRENTEARPSKQGWKFEQPERINILNAQIDHDSAIVVNGMRYVMPENDSRTYENIPMDAGIYQSVEIDKKEVIRFIHTMKIEQENALDALIKNYADEPLYIKVGEEKTIGFPPSHDHEDIRDFCEENKIYCKTPSAYEDKIASKITEMYNISLEKAGIQKCIMKNCPDITEDNVQRLADEIYESKNNRIPNRKFIEATFPKGYIIENAYKATQDEQLLDVMEKLDPRRWERIMEEKQGNLQKKDDDRGDR